jgi:plasmid stabilization system protein ParE
MTGRITYTPEAQQHLDDLDRWIADSASPDVAQRFITAVFDHIESIADFPQAGRPREDVRAGVRTTTFRKRTLVAYEVADSGTEVVVNILGVFHGGPDWETALRERG